MNARLRRIAADWEQIKKDFAGHKYIIIKLLGGDPPEAYQVTYFVNGINLLPDGKIEVLGRHEVEIQLHSDYPRYKPVCKIKTPIWHPNFRDGQICIGDIWGAGESLSDIIINIGDMIQYKSWNSFSPLSAEAAQWAIENKSLFPVGNIDLIKADYSAARQEFDIDLFDENPDELPRYAKPVDNLMAEGIFPTGASQSANEPEQSSNDFDITNEDLIGIEFVPSASRMQNISNNNMVKGKSINFKTIVTKGLIWGLIGGVIGFILQEVLNKQTSTDTVLRLLGYGGDSDLLSAAIGEKYTLDEFTAILKNAVRLSSGLFSMLIAMGIGILMGVGEGVYYGSKDNIKKYIISGAGISLVAGLVSGYIAQAMYSNILNDYSTPFEASTIRGIGWAIMGLGIGFASGMIKPDKKRILFCSIGGLSGGFIGGFIFNYIFPIVSMGEEDTGTMARAIGITVMGLLIGLGIGLLEQFAKQAWLKVIRGEFEGKEYLVFSGTTSIGNNSKNTIVLFKDKLVGPNHCDIILEGNKYILVDKNTPMGTVVNGQKIKRHVLRNGDTVAIGNSVLVFNTK